MARKLAIIAGRDDLPRLIAEDRHATGAPYLVVSFEQDTQEWMADHPHQQHQFEKPGRLFAALHKADVKEVVFAGRTTRPKLRPWLFDARALTLLPRIRTLLTRGDDGLLSGLAEVFEAEGFRLRAPHDVLGDVMAPGGMLGVHVTSTRDREDAVLGSAILAALGPFDVGQGVVVANGLCLGIETLGGTDRLLSQIADLPAEVRGEIPSGVLVKLPKTGQDLRMDLPSIGIQTVALASAAGLSGVVLRAGGANLIDRPALIAAADQAGIFLWAQPADMS